VTPTANELLGLVPGQVHVKRHALRVLHLQHHDEVCKANVGRDLVPWAEEAW